MEEGQISKAIGPFLNRLMMETNTFINLSPMKTGGKDKLVRARSIQARMRAGGVKFEKTGEWYQGLEDECMTFPRAKHDDQVDALSYLGLMVDKMIHADTEEEIEEEEWMEEHGKDADDGRSAVTGY